MTLEKGLEAFLDTLSGKNRSLATLRAYRTDVLQFLTFLKATNVAITEPGDIAKMDVLEYLSFLAKKGLTGIARSRKLSAIREYFRFLEGVGAIQKSPTTGIDTPKREKNTRQYLRSDEYTKMLSLAVTDCNRNGSGLQSRHFWDRIICLYPSPQDRIICH